MVWALVLDVVVGCGMCVGVRVVGDRVSCVFARVVAPLLCGYVCIAGIVISVTVVVGDIVVG